MPDQLVVTEYEEGQHGSSQALLGRAMVKNDRRRKFCIRRRTRGSKYYGSRIPRPDERNPHESVSLVGSSLLGVEELTVVWLEPVCTDRMEELTDLQVDSSDIEFGETDPGSFDGAILMAPDEVSLEFLDELPPGFHLDDEGRHIADAGGVRRRHFELVRLQRAAETEPDWGDPERWDMGRYEPTHLIVRTV